MDRLITELLAYSRLSRGALNLSPIDLDAVVSDVLAQLRGELAAAKAAVAVRSPLGRVTGDHGALWHIVANLVVNAAKFARPDVAPEIVIRGERRGAICRLWVEDNGIGIAREHIPRLFKVFERLHGQEAYLGSGIGLATVLRAAKRLGGDAGVESEPGCGSRFWVDVPAAEPQQQQGASHA
jgi:signal transduction histidine kinase